MVTRGLRKPAALKDQVPSGERATALVPTFLRQRSVATTSSPETSSYSCRSWLGWRQITVFPARSRMDRVVLTDGREGDSAIGVDRCGVPNRNGLEKGG